MTAIRQVKAALAQCLSGAGLAAVSAFEEERLKRYAKPVVVVGARRVSVERTGLLDYLGERYDESSGSTVEVYGRTMKLTLSLDVYSPREKGASEGEAAAEAATQALTAALPEGLRTEELSWEQTAWDKDSGMFRLAGTASFTALFTAQAKEDDAVLTKFILRGAISE